MIQIKSATIGARRSIGAEDRAVFDAAGLGQLGGHFGGGLNSWSIRCNPILCPPD